jgi:hypothetical protein
MDDELHERSANVHFTQKPFRTASMIALEPNSTPRNMEFYLRLLTATKVVQWTI